MGGSIKRADGTWWSHNIWFFHWLMDTMAEATRDAELAAHLREIEDNNFRHLGLGELTEEQRREAVRVIVDELPHRIESSVTDPDAWESYHQIVAELAAFVSDDR